MTCKQAMRAKRPLPFSNEAFLKRLADLTGIPPVGVLGRETPLDLTTLEGAQGSLLLKEVFSKYDDGLPSEDKEMTTWKRFYEAEEKCRQTNLAWSRTPIGKDPFWVGVRRRIWKTLGNFSWDEAAKHFAHGPGSTTRHPKARAYAAYKYSGKPESTSGNAVLAMCAIKHIPLWTHSVHFSAEVSEDRLVELRESKDPLDFVTVVPGNSVIAVPKNYKTNRTIAKEPCMNVYVQKGIGACIRRRLNSVGVNLNDQTRNQKAALAGSRTGELATVDLSMASDTLAYEVVAELLPNDWWWALEQCRSPVGVLPCGTKIKYHKFSSMGNGYTFELESLIFWAICQQVCRSNVEETEASVCVYGDDLIVPSCHYDQLSERLMEAGFTPNPSKSFGSGPYRESCGKHYFHGADITPFYVRKPVRELHRLFLAHNNLYRFGQRTGIDVSSFCAEMRSLAPASWRNPRLPDGYGDGAFIAPFDTLQMDSHPHGWEYWQVSALVQTSIELEGDLPVGQLLASLNEVEARRAIVGTSVLRRLTAFRNRQYPHRPKVGPVRVHAANDEQLDLSEARSGLPARVGQYRVTNILIPRHPQPL